jgi:UDP-2,3-diacylglucosamine pyrophosphatase LpxH
MTDEQFLSYVETHSQTPRALFFIGDIRRLMKLSGEPEDIRGYNNKKIQVPTFLSFHYEDAKLSIEKARARLKKETS